MTAESAVDRLYREAAAVIQALGGESELSLRVSAADNLRKSLLLAAASHYEQRITSAVTDFVREASGGSCIVEQFVRNKAIARQYHTWFKWDDNNANHFFGLFGHEFRALMVSRVKEREDLQLSVRSFLELGNERNRLVHGDYATFTLEKTMEEIYSLYIQGLLFVSDLPDALRECDIATRSTGPQKGVPQIDN